MRVMVTGSRRWTDVERIRAVLSKVKAEHVVLIHGDCDGADKIAAQIATELGWDVVPYAAEWSAPCLPQCPLWHRLERAHRNFCPDAGKRRNAEMLASKPDVVYAFPCNSAKGTWHVVALAKKQGIPVVITKER